VTTASPMARDLAQQVLRHEANGQQDAAALAEAVERAGARLRARLVVRFGPAGFEALLTRSLRLARGDTPSLELVRYDDAAAGGLRGAGAFANAHADDPATVAAGLAAILAYLIRLLSTFIGADLAVRLVRDTWPDLPDGPGNDESESVEGSP
jgi:hypothetical protein